MLTSDPAEVDIFIRDLDRSEQKQIGKSPQTLTPELLKSLGYMEPFIVTFRKQGFLEENLLISRIPAGGSFVARMKSIADSGPSYDVNNIVRLVLEGERNLIEKNSKTALETAAWRPN